MVVVWLLCCLYCAQLLSIIFCPNCLDRRLLHVQGEIQTPDTCLSIRALASASSTDVVGFGALQVACSNQETRIVPNHNSNASVISIASRGVNTHHLPCRRAVVVRPRQRCSCFPTVVDGRWRRPLVSEIDTM
ncbi:hypothetical protein S245_028376 [Arachis hypogaea]